MSVTAVVGGPVGRRGQGQDRRPARRAGAARHPRTGRRQRRPHGHQSAGPLCPAPGAGRHLQPRDALRHRHRRGAQPGHPARRARRAPRARREDRQPADQRARPPGDALPSAGSTVPTKPARGSQAIGTTGRGIGPCYVDKVARTGLRAGDLRDPAAFREKLAFVIERKREILAAIPDAPAWDWRRRRGRVPGLRRAPGALRPRSRARGQRGRGLAARPC